ncbi:MAG: flavin reductase [Eubacteriales bacterium]
MPFKKISQRDVDENVFDLINRDCFLITTKLNEKTNAMTASWGGMGHIWGKDMLFCVIRPQRYTYEFIEQLDYYTLCFFEDKKHRKELGLLGSVSGRDTDKITSSGLTVIDTAHGTSAFEEARLIYVLRKVYYQDFDPSRFLASEINDTYAAKDYHRMYFGEIVECLIRE